LINYDFQGNYYTVKNAIFFTVMLRVVVLNIIALSITMPSVVAPRKQLGFY